MRVSGVIKLLRVARNRLKRRDTVFFSPAIPDNPYQALLYSAAPETFIAMPSQTRAEWIAKLGLVRAVHYHWEEAFFWRNKGAPPDLVAEEGIRSIRALKALGVKLVWTCHNREPHEASSESYRKAFETMRRFMTSEADLIHVHSEFARSYLGRAYGVAPERVAVIPHPSYLEHYAEPPLRTSIGERRRFLVFGAMRRYKGLAEITEAFQKITASPRVESVTFSGAGDPKDFPVAEWTVPLVLNLSRVPDHDIPDLFARADFMVLALTKSLTSGSALLAMTFGVPLIVPNHPGVVENLPKELGGLIYDPSVQGDLSRAIDAACTMERESYVALSQACLQHARDIAPSRQSAALVSAMADRGILCHRA